MAAYLITAWGENTSPVDDVFSTKLAIGCVSEALFLTCPSSVSPFSDLSLGLSTNRRATVGMSRPLAMHLVLGPRRVPLLLAVLKEPAIIAA
jgi:hypothetical protein